MAQRSSYILQARGIPVEAERRGVKRITLRVRPDGTACMSVPWRVGRDQAQAFLDAHAEWLERAVARAKARPLAGAGPDEKGRVPLWGRTAALPEGMGVTDFYKDALAHRLPEVVARMESASGLHASGWQLRDMTSRWGSCTPSSGKVRINARLAAYDPLCLDYVVAHELAHLAEPSHNARFHEIVAGFFPYEKEARAMLREPPVRPTDTG